MVILQNPGGILQKNVFLARLWQRNGYYTNSARKRSILLDLLEKKSIVKKLQKNGRKLLKKSKQS